MSTFSLWLICPQTWTINDFMFQESASFKTIIQFPTNKLLQKNKEPKDSNSQIDLNLLIYGLS